ncbi:hypothetical protein IMCC3317_01540 [Kordia antarctica]|uniref:Uncharacterized protein n=1 Tax=Kordia antarctica TaxID=1218801 RepID=A0A7L4ZE28_9FLAO|nr:hypothetical protein [Kordia antarctica]QHI34810.1 hypothetical protein IMCC3317_01540 [Kordia antarctica]
MLKIKQVLLVLFVFTITFSFAQEDKIVPAKKVDIADMVKDVQIIRKNEDNFKMVWWIPLEYWEVSIGDSNLGQSGVLEQITRIFEGYTLVCTINTDISPFGGLIKKSSKIQLKDTKGNIYDEIKDEEIPDEYESMLTSMKPAMAQMLGQFGKQMEFHVFPEKAKDGTLMAAPLSKGEFTVLFNETEEFKFKLPLSSLVEKKECPKDGELLNGNWEFCPWHGKKLKLQTK